MKVFKYEPQLKRADGSKVFEGTVSLRIPNLKERIQMAKSMNLKMNAEGELDLADGMDLIETLLDKVKESIVEVDLKMGDIEFKSPDDIDYYAEGMELIKEIGEVLSKGLSLGNG